MRIEKKRRKDNERKGEGRERRKGATAGCLSDV